jgi:hypothetical protein
VHHPEKNPGINHEKSKGFEDSGAGVVAVQVVVVVLVVRSNEVRNLV